jgi:site-specific recombinase XerD
LDIYVNGQRKKEKLAGLVLVNDKAANKETMRLAEIAKARRAQQVFAGEWGLIDPVKGKHTLFEYISKIAEKRAPRDRMRRVIKYLKVYRNGATILISQVNEQWVKEFQDYLVRDTDLSEASAWQYSSALRFALNQAVREKIILRSPAIGVKCLNPPAADKIWLSQEEIQCLAKTTLGGRLGSDIRKAFLYGCYTGLRISDLKTLKWGDIELSSLQIIKRQEKTKDSVFIPLHNIAWKLINDGTIHDFKVHVFPALAAISHQYHARLHQWAKKAGLKKKIGWHTARHTFAVQALEAGADIYTVSKLLGHSSLKTTQVYAKATDKMRRAAVDALPVIEIGK